ncbi:MAG: hypothetical protein HKN29_15810 [Rhodothermales bacterium]|nr:hypothetical protein [Rhodothermales bacterium]
MRLPSHQANRVLGSADCIDGSITGEVQNYSDWFLTVITLEVYVQVEGDKRPIRASECVLRLPEPVPPGGQFVFSRRVSKCSGESNWTWHISRAYGFPKVREAV